MFGVRRRRGTLELPAEEAQFEMLSSARDYLKQHGYIHYELLNYAKPGFESRHNCLYWANAETLGLGPGAYSYFDGRRFRHSASYEQYLDKISHEDWSAFEEEFLDKDKKEIESFLLALRLTEGVNLASFGAVVKKFKQEISELSEKGLLIQEKEKLRLSAKGQFLAESVFSDLSL